jgi:hypothetical protein
MRGAEGVAKSSKPRKLDVFELKGKLKFLAGLMKWTRTALARQAQIPSSALDDAVGLSNKKAGNAGGDSRLGPGHCEKLGVLFGFPAVDGDEPTWPEWIDRYPKPGRRRDTAAAFKAKYQEVYGDSVGGTAGGASRRAEVVVAPPPVAAPRNTSVQLKEGTRTPADPPPFASITLDVGQVGEGKCVLGFLLICPEVHWCGFKVGLGRGVVEFGLAPARYAPGSLQGLLGMPAVEVAKGAVLIECTSGATTAPRYDLCATAHLIGTVETLPTFMSVVDLAAGDVVKVKFGLHIWDFELMDGGTDPLTVTNDNQVVVLPPKEGTNVPLQEMSEIKRKVLKHLAATSILSSPKNGFRVLTEDAVQFVKANLS